MKKVYNYNVSQYTAYITDNSGIKYINNIEYYKKCNEIPLTEPQIQNALNVIQNIEVIDLFKSAAKTKKKPTWVWCKEV